MDGFSDVFGNDPDDDTLARAEALVRRARELNVVLACAESCTGGLVGGAITAVAGSSAVFDRGWVTYSNAAKSEQLGVSPALIREHGAVSLDVAGAMAAGALARSQAHLAVATTGIAGPDGGSSEKPVGLVWFGLAKRDGQRRTRSNIFSGLDRAGVRLASVNWVLDWMLDSLQDNG